MKNIFCIQYYIDMMTLSYRSFVFNSSVLVPAPLPCKSTLSYRDFSL